LRHGRFGPEAKGVIVMVQHGAMRKLLERLAVARPLVVLFDDLHGCDGASIELLAALLRRGPDAAVLLALAFRPMQAVSGSGKT
jgi:predicted ATPase